MEVKTSSFSYLSYFCFLSSYYGAQKYRDLLRNVLETPVDSESVVPSPRPPRYNAQAGKRGARREGGEEDVAGWSGRGRRERKKMERDKECRKVERTMREGHEGREVEEGEEEEKEKRKE